MACVSSKQDWAVGSSYTRLEDIQELMDKTKLDLIEIVEDLNSKHDQGAARTERERLSMVSANHCHGSLGPALGCFQTVEWGQVFGWQVSSTQWIR